MSEIEGYPKINTIDLFDSKQGYPKVGQQAERAWLVGLVFNTNVDARVMALATSWILSISPSKVFSVIDSKGYSELLG